MIQTDAKKKGDQKFAKGMDLITKGLLNWSKDYVSAATQFDEALDLYKKAQAYPECIKTLNKLIKCNDKNREYIFTFNSVHGPPLAIGKL